MPKRPSLGHRERIPAPARRSLILIGRIPGLPAGVCIGWASGLEVDRVFLWVKTTLGDGARDHQKDRVSATKADGILKLSAGQGVRELAMKPDDGMGPECRFMASRFGTMAMVALRPRNLRCT